MEEQNQTNENLEQESQAQQDYNPVPEEEVIEKKKNLPLIISGIVLILIIIGGGVYWWLQNARIKTEIKEDDIVSIQEDNTVVEEENEAKEFFNFLHLNETERDRMKEIFRALVFNNNEYLESFPKHIRESFQEEIDDMNDSIEEGDITEEELNELFEKMLAYHSYEEVAFVDYLLTTDTDGDGLNLYFEYIYYSDDNKKDTDGDGQDDLEEVENESKPNSNLEKEETDLLLEVKELLESDNLNIQEVVDLCMESRTHRDECLDAVSFHADDLSFCEEVKYYSAFGSRGGREESSVVSRCKNRIEGVLAYQSGQEELCIELEESYAQDNCLFKHVVEQKSLEPCTSSQSFESCLYVGINSGDINSLDDSSDCLEYIGSFSSAGVFNLCILSTVEKEEKIDSCYYLQGIPPAQCMRNVLGYKQEVCEEYGGTWDGETYNSEKKCLSPDPTKIRPYFGILGHDITEEIASEHDLALTEGKWVTVVSPLTPASEAGILVDDIIMEVDGIKVTTEGNTTRDILSNYVAGQEISLKIWSVGEIKNVTVVLRGYDDDYYPSRYDE